MDDEEFVSRWIAFHTTYVIEGELATRWTHYNTIDLRDHGYRPETYQPVHRLLEDWAQGDPKFRSLILQIVRVPGSSFFGEYAPEVQARLGALAS